MKTVHKDSIAYRNGRIYTLDGADSIAEAISIVDGRIAAVGSEAHVTPYVPASVRIVDLEGRAVLPGFIDAHTHVELGAYAGRVWLDIRAKSPAETLEMIVREARSRPGEWIVAQGTFGQPLPGLEELDSATPDNPVVIRQSMHRLQANSVALRLARIERDTSPWAASRIQRDAACLPTGVVEEGFDLFPIPYPDEDELTRLLADEATESFVRMGVTTVYELPATLAAMRAWQRLATSGDLPLRVSLNLTVAPGHQPLLRCVDDFTRFGLRSGFGNASLKLGAMKMFLDGDEDAAFTRSQLDGPPRGWGLVTHTYWQLRHILAECFRAGVQVWIHAIGDAAQQMAFDAIEEVVDLFPGYDHRTRLEHISNECSDRSEVQRMAAARIIPVPTAAFMYAQGEIPDVAAAGTPVTYYMYRSLLEAGLQPPGNSDSAGTQPFATNPWFSISCMLNRKDRCGRLVSPEERVDLRAAIRVHTVNGAYAAFEEKEKGSLETGKLGDLVVLDRDPFSVPPEEIDQVQTHATVVGGTVVCEQ